MTFHSQTNQDRYLYKTFFRSKMGGTFLDIGAYDGVHLSNTLFFETELGWKGLCIEPHPRAFRELVKNRSATCVCCAIGPDHGEAEFSLVEGALEPEMLSGLTVFYDSSHMKRFRAEAEQAQAQLKTIQVQMAPLRDILQVHGITHVDYCSIDVEGAEMAVLESIDFDEVTIDVFTVENNFGTNGVRHFMMDNGYRKYADLGVDEVFVRAGYRK